MSNLPTSRSSSEFHPACHRPGCHRSPFDLIRPFSLDGPLLRSGFGNTFQPIFAEMSRALNKIERESKVNSDGLFEVYIDVQHFLPNEITVSVENNSIVVHAKHEEKNDEHGFVSREFTRRYDLPQNFNPEDVVSNISSDGVLSIRAPPASSVHHIPIEQDGSTHSGNEAMDVQK
ncbi:heat shock protein beta-6-like [Contarinia nasturtii]|uniref:heat shock protein beta-6-like n=1 Tax=Contarinia nasturtii TaxID=265458 RepID=UPI0012D3F9EC|nr:heat shock protein beta-6-like [Contarinia nasturtii]